MKTETTPKETGTRGCHKCKHAAAVAAGKYRNVPWDRTPCAACGLRESSLGTLPVDEERLAEEPETGFGVADPLGTACGDGGVSVAAGSVEWSGHGEAETLPVSVMGSVVRGLLSLPPRARDTVCLRYQGRTYREIAELLGSTVSAVEMQHWRAMRAWPDLRALFPAKAKRQARRGAPPWAPPPPASRR